MKRKRLIILLAAVLLTALLPAAAFAAEVTASTDPTRLEEAGTVTLVINITNDGAAAMENIAVTGPNVNYSASGKTIEPGGSMYLPLSGMPVSEDMLGQELTYTVTWTENGEVKSKNVSVTVGYANELAFTAKASADKTKAVTGDTIVMTYTIVNTGTVDLKNVVIKDKKLNRSTPVAEASVIKAGETFTATFNYKMKDATVISSPVITYKTGKDNTERTYSGVKQITLNLINSQLTIDITQGDTTEEGTPFTIRLENNGNQTLKKLVVTDELGNRLNEEGFALTVGENRTLSYVATTDSTREVRFTITGVDGAGLDYEEKTSRYTVRAYIDPSLLGLSFAPSFVTPLSTSGTATVRFTVTNSGSVDMTDAVLTEETLGTVKEIGTIAPGSDSFEEELTIGEPRQMKFVLTAKDPVGNECTYTSYINAAYATAVSAPAATPRPTIIAGEEVVEETSSGTGNGGSLGDSLLTMTIIVGVLLVAALITLFVMKKKDKERYLRARAKMRQSMNPRLRAEAERTKNIPPSVHSGAVRRETERTNVQARPSKAASPHTYTVQSGSNAHARITASQGVKRAPANAPRTGAGRTEAQGAHTAANRTAASTRTSAQTRTASRTSVKRSAEKAPAAPYRASRSLREESERTSAQTQTSRTKVRRVQKSDE